MLDRVAPAWVAWIAHQLHQGETRDSIANVLAEEGLDAADATALVERVARDPVFRALRPTLAAVQLRRAMLEKTSTVPTIAPEPELYLHGFALAQTPVVLRGATSHWRAHTWTWPELVERVGDVELSVTVERDAAEEPDLPDQRHTRMLSFEALVERVLDPSTGNDTYVTASDAAVTHLAELLDDLAPLPGIASTAKGVGFWIGGAGAHTPLHRDLSTTLLAPLFGRKRVALVPPEALPPVREHRFWAERYDLDAPDSLARLVTIGPGDALSIPAGWWHQVDTLEPCFLVTLANLDGTTNRFDRHLFGAPIDDTGAS